MPSQKYYDGSAWQTQNTPKYYDGGGWSSGTLNYYDASSWVTVGGSQATVLESFERTSPLDAYSGDTGAASILTSDPYDGSKYLEMSSTGESAITRTDIAFQQGESVGLHVQSGAMFFIGVQSATGRSNLSGYKLEVVPGNGYLKIWVVTDGSQTELGETKTDSRGSGWFEFTVDWGTDDTITISSSATSDTQTVTDSTYSSGGIGWGVYDTTLKYDYLHW